MAGQKKQCKTCGGKHAPPTGKNCKRPRVEDTVAAEVVEIQQDLQTVQQSQGRQNSDANVNTNDSQRDMAPSGAPSASGGHGQVQQWESPARPEYANHALPRRQEMDSYVVNDAHGARRRGQDGSDADVQAQILKQLDRVNSRLDAMEGKVAQVTREKQRT